jgi:hypothetical protein
MSTDRLECREFVTTGQALRFKSNAGFLLSGPLASVKNRKLAWKLRQHPNSKKSLPLRVALSTLKVDDVGFWQPIGSESIEEREV